MLVFFSLCHLPVSWLRPNGWELAAPLPAGGPAMILCGVRPSDRLGTGGSKVKFVTTGLLFQVIGFVVPYFFYPTFAWTIPD